MCLTEMNAIPLSDSQLCLDCNFIIDNPQRCPMCGSGALMSLATVLNREPEKDAKLRVSDVEASGQDLSSL